MLTNTKGFFKNNTNDFYFITYDNIYNYSSGFIKAKFDKNFDVTNIDIIENSISPFEFLDRVEIQEINFILKNKFVYYKLKRKTNNNYYYGIIDIELNKVVFNTDEAIISFIPYSDKAMLAITSTTAYRICAFNDGDKCIDNCTVGYILDTSGNKCGTSCNLNKIKLMPHEVCIDLCNTTMYIIKGQECGQCKYFNPERPYKFINESHVLIQFL